MLALGRAAALRGEHKEGSANTHAKLGRIDDVIDFAVYSRPDGRCVFGSPICFDLFAGSGCHLVIAQESNGKFGVETGIGVEMAVSENAKVGLTYEYDWRDDYSAHTGLLNLKYAF